MAITDLVPWKRGEKNVSVKREEENPFYTLHQEMDRLFDDFFGRSSLAPFYSGFMERSGGFNPCIDVTENDKEIKVTAELPGLDEKDVEVSLSNNVLTISGEKKAEKEDQGKSYYRLERSYGSFQQVIPLPAKIETDKVEAKFKNGVLTISLPKIAAGPQGQKKIAIKNV